MSESTPKVGMYKGRQFSLEPLPTDPTLLEIVDCCERIRAGWSEAEKRRRSAWMQPERWSLQSVEADELGLDPNYSQ